jgi:hypothetical protein
LVVDPAGREKLSATSRAALTAAIGENHSKDGRKVQTLHHVGRDETPRLAIGGGHIYFALYSEQGIRRIRLAVQ